MKRTSIKIALFLSVLSLTFTSCLKDAAVDEGRIGITPNKGQRIAEIAGSPTGFINVDVIGSPRDTTFTMVIVRLASETPAENDIQVTLTSDHSLVTAYNAAHATNYQAAPTSAYQFSPLAVTIPKGQREGTLTLKAIPNNLFAAQYAFGFRITSVSDPSITISGNYGTQVVALTVRNKYDGFYKVVSGSVQRYAGGAPEAAGGLNGSLAGNPEVALVTTGPNSLGIPAPVSPNPGTLYWANGSNSQVAGIDNVRLSIDPVTNAVTMSSLGNATLTNWPGRENRYDPATQTFYLNFHWNPTAPNKREYSVVLKYSKPR